MKCFFWIFIAFFVFACSKSERHLEYTIEVQNDTTIVYSFIHKNGAKFKIGMYENDSLLFFSNTPKDYTQFIRFHKNGNIEAKFKTRDLDVTFGRVYHFYEQTGNLEVDWELVNDIPYGVRIEYHDISTDHVKEIMRFYDDGTIKHRLFIDEEGNVTAVQDKENCLSEQE